MKTTRVINRHQLESVEIFEGEHLEQKIERIMISNEPIKDGATLIYTERKDGVQPAYNIRTDRWDIAHEGMAKADKIKTAKREEKARLKAEAEKTKNNTPPDAA